MPDAPDFAALSGMLQRAGIAPRYVRRAVDELAWHYEDLVAELEQHGCDPALARRDACRQLGDLDAIGRQLAVRRELKCWYYRWPQLARVALPVACVAALPVTPVIAGVQHAALLFRWGFCLLCSAVFTAFLLLILQLSLYLN